MTDVARLRRHRKLGVRILIEFINATPKTAAGLVERERVWAHDLIPLVEAFGDGTAARFEPLSPMLLVERSMVAGLLPLDDEFNEARRCHSVRMYRLDQLFQQFKPVMPKGKGGNRRTYNDDAIVAKARAIMESNGTSNKMEAARKAMARHPDLVEARTIHQDNIAKRIAGKM